MLFCFLCFVLFLRFVSGFGGSQVSPDLLNSGTQEEQGPSCEKSFNREELIGGAGPGWCLFSAVPLHECLQLPSGLCWRKYLNFPTLVLFQDSPGYTAPSQEGQRTRGSPAGQCLLCLHLTWICLGFFASLCPHECTNNANQQSCKYGQS